MTLLLLEKHLTTETVGAIKMMIMATGAFDEAVILKETDFNKIVQKASDISSSYKSPNS